MNSNTRRIFVNVLVNGNIYQKRVAIDIQEDDFVIKSYGLDHYLKEWLVINYRKIPSELLSYEIVNEVTEKQSKAIDFLFDSACIAKKNGGARWGGGRTIENGIAKEIEFFVQGIGRIIIHAKDIVTKD